MNSFRINTFWILFACLQWILFEYQQFQNSLCIPSWYSFRVPGCRSFWVEIYFKLEVALCELIFAFFWIPNKCPTFAWYGSMSGSSRASWKVQWVSRFGRYSECPVFQKIWQISIAGKQLQHRCIYKNNADTAKNMLFERSHGEL